MILTGGRFTSILYIKTEATNDTSISFYFIFIEIVWTIFFATILCDCEWQRKSCGSIWKWWFTNHSNTCHQIMEKVVSKCGCRKCFFFFSIVFNASTVFSFLKLFNTSDSLLLSQFFLSSQYLLNPTSSSCQFSCHCPSKSKRGYLTLQKCSLS